MLVVSSQSIVAFAAPLEILDDQQWLFVIAVVITLYGYMFVGQDHFEPLIDSC